MNMVSNKIKRTHTKRRRQTKRNTKKKNAISRKNRMIGGKNRKIQYPDKAYDGQVWPELSMNIPHGKGTMTWNNGDVYNGQWKYGKMSGRGTMTRHDGTSYTGNWRNDKMNGFGSFRYANNKVLQGIWADNMPTGNLKLIWPNVDPIRSSSKIVKAEEFDDFPYYDNKSDASTMDEHHSDSDASTMDEHHSDIDDDEDLMNRFNIQYRFGRQ